MGALLSKDSCASTGQWYGIVVICRPPCVCDNLGFSSVVVTVLATLEGPPSEVKLFVIH